MNPAKCISTPENDQTILDQDLKPQLGFYSVLTLVLGSVIGSGIFVSAGSMARSSTSNSMYFSVWIGAGLMTIVGALTQCELARSMPRTGGLYTYLREAFGDATGFFFGWASFMVAGSGGIAAVAFIFSSYLGEFYALPQLPDYLAKLPLQIPYLGQLFPFADMGAKAVAAVMILLLTMINVRGLQFGSWLQVLSTTFKVIAILMMIGAGLLWDQTTGLVIPQQNQAPSVLSLSPLQSFGLIVTALSSAFWAYDGWTYAAYVGGEVKNAKRNLPLAIIVGTLLVMLVYGAVNFSYLHVFSLEELGALPGDRVASALLTKVLGPWGGLIVAGLILLSTFDCTNTGILTTARVYFAMARDRLFLKSAGTVHPKYNTPSKSLWIQCGWSLCLLFSGSFDLLMSMYVFVSWLFYLLMAVAVFKIKLRQNSSFLNQWRGLVLPSVFCLFTSFYLVVTLITDIQSYYSGESAIIKSLVGLLLIALGLPFYGWILRKQKKEEEQLKLHFEEKIEDRHTAHI